MILVQDIFCFFSRDSMIILSLIFVQIKSSDQKQQNSFVSIPLALLLSSEKHTLTVPLYTDHAIGWGLIGRHKRKARHGSFDAREFPRTRQAPLLGCHVSVA
jgi:hypothetical protein